MKQNTCTSLFRHTQYFRLDTRVFLKIVCYTDLHKGGRSLDVACWTLVKKQSILSMIMDDTECCKFL